MAPSGYRALARACLQPQRPSERVGCAAAPGSPEGTEIGRGAEARIFDSGHASDGGGRRRICVFSRINPDAAGPDPARGPEPARGTESAPGLEVPSRASVPPEAGGAWQGVRCDSALPVPLYMGGTLPAANDILREARRR
jgi:hypothetical protein